MLVKSNQLKKEYDNIMQFNPNKFSDITTDKIKDDMIQILEIKDPNIVLEDNILIIKGENIKFENEADNVTTKLPEFCICQHL